MKLDSILVIADRKDDHTALALRRAASLLSGTKNASIHLVGFVFEGFVESSTILDKQESETYKKEIIERREADLNELLKELSLADVKIDLQVVWQREIDKWVVREAAKSRYDLVMKTGNRTETLWYMPTDWKLLRDCPAPTYIAARKSWRKKAVVLATLDADSRKKTQQTLNRQVLEASALLAERLGAELHVCHVIAVSQVLRDMDLVDMSRLKKSFAEKSRQKLLDLAAEYGVPADAVHVSSGVTYKEIPRQANRLKAEMVVMGGFGRKGVSGAMLGNTAEQVISLLRTDVVVVKHPA